MDTKNYNCFVCEATFTNRKSLTRHVNKLHKKLRFNCDQCLKEFVRSDDLQRHVREHSKIPLHSCQICEKSFSRLDCFKKHLKIHKKHMDIGISVLKKRKRTLSMEDQTPPKKRCEIETALGMNKLEEDPVLFPNNLLLEESMDTSLAEFYIKHWTNIRTQFKEGCKIQDAFNIRLASLSSSWLKPRLLKIFEKRKCAFKLSYSFGFILRNLETGEYHYFYSCLNNMSVSTPVLIKNQTDLEMFLSEFELMDLLEEAKKQRHNTKFVVELVTNLTFYFTNILGHPIGTSITLPVYVLHNKGLMSLISDKHGIYNDHLCFFRCLTVHLKGSTNLESNLKGFLTLYLQHKNITLKSFPGITLEDLPVLENLFQISIFVYQLEKDLSTKKITAQLIHRSLKKYEPMYLNLYDKHFSYIQDIKKYSHSFSCKKCGTLWKHIGKLHRHELTCTSNVKHIFKGGVYQTALTIFERLEDINITVPEKDRYFPFKVTFDLESLLLPLENCEKNTEKLIWETLHKPISISVASNVPDFEKPICFVYENPNELVDTFINYLLKISSKSNKLLTQKFSAILNELEILVQKEKEIKSSKNPYQNILTSFKHYLCELPVIGFNSGNYDVNVIKKYLFPVLLDKTNLKFTIKRNNNFMCLTTEYLKFLDIRNYLAPGVNYSQFLKAYNSKEQKGFFPYEWLTDFSKLNQKSLPPHSEFYSSLKQSNITAVEYQYCQTIWQKKHMSTMKDFLIWYNNNDVEPFLKALENMFDFYKDRQIDMFKDGISLPGLTLKYLFKISKNPCITLFSEKHKDLYYTLKNSIVGGPSIIFHRYHEADETYIRDVEMKNKGLSPKLCKKIIGFDANALYLFCFMQEMPTGFCIQRKSENNFKPEYSWPASKSSRHWLEWEAYIHNIHIQHAFNSKEKRIGPKQLPVDGYCKQTHTVYQFQGCYYHQHACKLTNFGQRIKSYQKQYLTVDETTAYIKSLGYTYKQIWECEWLKTKKSNPNIEIFLNKYVALPLEYKKQLNQNQILQAIKNNDIFGLVECDIYVPDHLKEHFSEMPPIFKNVDISPKDTGLFMEKYAEDNGISDHPRRCLIGSMFGEKIILITPLLKWYMNQGLEVRKIHQLIQFKPSSCFLDFADAVSDARRAGDADIHKSILAETMKLLGNSAYGKTLTNKEKFKNVHYYNEGIASHKVNSQLFCQLEEITSDCYEMSFNKRTIKMDLPLQLGVFILQYAKLRMLEFYYDFLLKFIEPSNFQLCEMDTDSAYIALSEITLEEVIKPSMRKQYEKEKHLWFPRTDTVEHAAYDKRTPGLFKEEWSGEGIVALCSKTYYCFGGDKDKFSCKGVSRKNISKEKYIDVLINKICGQGKNNGFRVKNNEMYTYVQEKDAFTYYYPKRIVLDDGVTTIPSSL